MVLIRQLENRHLLLDPFFDAHQVQMHRHYQYAKSSTLFFKEPSHKEVATVKFLRQLVNWSYHNKKVPRYSIIVRVIVDRVCETSEELRLDDIIGGAETEVGKLD